MARIDKNTRPAYTPAPELKKEAKHISTVIRAEFHPMHPLTDKARSRFYAERDWTQIRGDAKSKGLIKKIRAA